MRQFHGASFEPQRFNYDRRDRSEGWPKGEMVEKTEIPAVAKCAPS